MKLSDFAQGRDNNFNLIRIVAAFTVLISHCFVLDYDIASGDPLFTLVGMDMGKVAVDVFFIASGFLVTASLLRRTSAFEFVWARVLRIFPALIVMLLLTVFGLGLFFTTAPRASYLTDAKTYLYLAKCSTLVAGLAYKLPGVFEANPYKDAVNGSLWTLRYEVTMYAILLMTWVMLRLVSRLRSFTVTIVSGTLLAWLLVIASHFYLAIDFRFLKLFFMFFTGASFYVLKDRIVLSRALVLSFLLALLLASLNKQAFFVVYTLTLAYILLYVAYIPAGFIRKYNRVGDYSYGVYIYAFPIQQSIAASIPGVSVQSMMLISAAISIILAIVSWHCLERRALGLKERFATTFKTAMAGFRRAEVEQLKGVENELLDI